jgi:hypothetical protein
MVDLNVEFVNSPNALDYCGLASTLAFIGCDGSFSTIATRNLSTTIVTMRLHGQLGKTKRFLMYQK